MRRSYEPPTVTEVSAVALKRADDGRTLVVITATDRQALLNAALGAAESLRAIYGEIETKSLTVEDMVQGMEAINAGVPGLPPLKLSQVNLPASYRDELPRCHRAITGDPLGARCNLPDQHDGPCVLNTREGRSN